MEATVNHETFDVEVITWDDAASTLTAIRRFSGDATLKQFTMRAHNEAVSIYIAVSSTPVTATWWCFAWRSTDSAQLRRGPVTVKTVALTPKQRSDLGVTDAAGNLTAIVPPLLK